MVIYWFLDPYGAADLPGKSRDTDNKRPRVAIKYILQIISKVTNKRRRSFLPKETRRGKVHLKTSSGIFVAIYVLFRQDIKTIFHLIDKVKEKFFWDYGKYKPYVCNSWY